MVHLSKDIDNIWKWIYERLFFEFLMQAPWCDECDSFENVVIQSGVYRIGEFAFADCSNIKDVFLPNSIRSIADSAFYGCTGLTGIALPDDLTYIGSDAFAGCINLDNVIIPDSVTQMGDEVFYNCSSLMNVTISDNMSNIPDRTFCGCTSLAEITIPEGVTSLDSMAFSGCSNLTHIILPESVMDISTQVFYGCSSLTNINIPESVTNIGNESFWGCSGLVSIVIPESVTDIGDQVFYGCSNLTDVTMMESVKNIGSGVFKGCPNLRMDTDGFRIISGWFLLDYKGTERNVIIPDGVTTIYSEAFNLTGVNSVIIPDSVTCIGERAFRSCSLTTITIPKKVIKLTSQSFPGCTSLKYIGVAIENPFYSSKDGVLFNKQMTELICFPTNKSAINYSIPHGVTIIDSYAFYKKDFCESIMIPSSVINICKSAFYYCRINKLYMPGRSEIFIDEDALYCTLTQSGMDITIYCFSNSAIELWARKKKLPTLLFDKTSPNKYVTLSLPQSTMLGVDNQMTLEPVIYPLLEEFVQEWSSSNPDVVSVSTNGILTGIVSGSATITLSYAGIQAECHVTVVQYAQNFSLSDLWLVSGTGMDAGNYITDIQPADSVVQFTWSTGNNDFATVNETGFVNSNSVGETTLTVTDVLSGLTRTAVIHICFQVDSISLSLAEELVCKGLSTNAFAIVSTGEERLKNKLVTFSTSNESIAAIDQNGNIQTFHTGVVTIIATADNGITANCQLTVREIQFILSLPSHLTSIETEAFADLHAVDAIRIPASVESIADDAFNNSNIIILTSLDSYAALWAKDHGITVIEE